jgi:hypothetical protein
MQMWSRGGSGLFLSSDSPNGDWRAVFEDDGETAYFYACAATGSESNIFDALQIRRAATASSTSAPVVQIVWSADGLKAALITGEQIDAIIDFARRKAFCRSNFPPASAAWGQRELWSDELLGLIS